MPLEGGRVPNYTAMRECVNEALTAQMPFVVVWDLPTIDTRIAYAYAGVVVNGERVFYSFSSTDNYITPGSDLVTTVSTCTQLEDLESSCGTLGQSLCLRCEVQATNRCQ